MRFKDWMQLDESRFKGFKRQFQQQYPEIPTYVANQMYQDRFGPQMGQVANHAANVLQQQIMMSDTPPALQQTLAHIPPPQNQSPTDILSNSGDWLQGVNWIQKPVTITVGPFDFDERTQALFRHFRFGFNPQDDRVRDDSNRHRTQRSLAQFRKAGQNEPIIAIRENGRYRLISGFHRTMSYLLSAHDAKQGAPADQVEILRTGGDIRGLDLNRWRPVPLKAYIGIKQRDSFSDLPPPQAA